MLVKVTLQSDADDYRDLLVANLKRDGAGLKDFPRQGFTPMYKGEALKLGDWVLVPFQAHGEAEKILPAVVIEIVDKPEASFSFKIKEVFATFTPSSATIKEAQKRVTADLFAKAARRAEFLKRLEKYRKLAKDDPAMAELVKQLEQLDVDGNWEDLFDFMVDQPDPDLIVY
ncbi:hypothetical protein [Limosilactobacillus fermentum]